MKMLIKDALIYQDVANALSNDGENEVIYCTTWQTGYPLFKDHAVGLNFENLKKVDKHGNPLLFWDHVKSADFIGNFDCHLQDEIAAIRAMYPEKSVWGSGKGQVIENDRIILKQWIEAFELPVNPYKIIKGITALKDYIKSNPKKYVKLNIFRGDAESFFAKDVDFNKVDFMKLEMALGPMADETMFIVEDPIETDVEVGYDGFFDGNEYSDKCFFGVEWHKNLYVASCRKFDDLPEPILETMDAFRPLLQRLDYRGALSTEEKIVSIKEHYLLDICSRLPSPLSALYPVFIKNWTEFVYKTGLKQFCPVDADVKYVGAFALESARGKEEYLPVEIKKSDRDKIRFQAACMKDGKYFSVKGNELVAVLVAGGDSPEEVLDKIKEYSKLVDCPGVNSDAIEGIDKMLDILETCKKSGIII